MTHDWDCLSLMARSRGAGGGRRSKGRRGRLGMECGPRSCRVGQGVIPAVVLEEGALHEGHLPEPGDWASHLSRWSSVGLVPGSSRGDL